jgi:hypothetical protein
MNAMLNRFDAATLALVLVAMMIAALRIGWWLGHMRKTHYGDVSNTPWYSAALSLLSLLLAFTVNTSIGKQNRRQQLVVADSRAIHDFYTQAGMLKQPTKSKLRGLITEYTRLRIELTEKSEKPSFKDALRRSDEIEAQMNELVAQVVEDGTPLAGGLTNAFDGIAGSGEERLAAGRDRLPTTVVLLLMSAALVATLLVGIEEGVSGRRHALGAGGFIFLVSFTVYVTLDLNQPERGRFTVSQGAMMRVLSSMPK